MHREIHLDTEKIQKTYSAPPRKKKKTIFFYGKVNVFQLFDFWPFSWEPINQLGDMFPKGTREHGYSHTFRREIEGVPYSTVCMYRLVVVYTHPCVCVYMSRRRPLGEKRSTHTKKKMGNLWPYVYTARRIPVFPWRWIDDGWPSDHHLPSAQESQRPSLVGQWSTHKRRQSIFSLHFWKSTSIA